MRDPKAHSKGGTLENTINTSRGGGGGGGGGCGGGGGGGSVPGDDAPPIMHPLLPGKVKIP